MRQGSHGVIVRINLAGTATVIASNRCRDCGHEWRDKPMGYARSVTCPNCRSEYWRWLNFVDEERRKPGHTAAS